MKTLNGTDLALFIKERQAKQVRMLRQAHGIFPRLAIVTNVENRVIDTYMRLKQIYGQDILVDVEIHRVDPEKTVQAIDALNNRNDVQAIIVQLPIANVDQTDQILNAVDPSKDVDGLHLETKFDAATPTAINWLLAGYGVDLVGKNIAIVGYGRLVGAPLDKMWQNSGLDVGVFTKNDDLSKLFGYDIIVTATGIPGIITNEMVKSGAVVVDAGTAAEDGVIRGDVAQEVRQRRDVTITPEKGGVGPLTVAALFDNVIAACLRLANAQETNQ